jgi:Ca-activated chloride channel family protein
MRYIFSTLLVIAVLLLAFTKKDPITVSGTVVDDQGNPLVNATVLVKGTKISTLTDAQGMFTIDTPGTDAILVFQYTGYESQEVKVKSQKKLQVKMKVMEGDLQEVVVTGSSSRTKKDITGSVVTINPNFYQNQQPYQQQLQGRAAGVNITSQQPGAAAKIRIRGMSSLNKSEEAKIYGSRSSRFDQAEQDFEREGYDYINENSFLKVSDNPLSTFSIDVDAASYSNVRRFIHNGQLPPAGSVRIEEMVNYFTYNYPQPVNDDPFSIQTEIAECPWNKDHRLVLVGLQGKKIPVNNLPPSNLVFLIDVSGSMQDPNKLPLVKASMQMLVDQLREEDHVAIVVYAGAAGLVLPSTRGSDKIKIKHAIEALEAGGSTAGGAGIILAYATAKNYFIKDGNNRVILCTDGDFNIGASSDDAMERLIEEERKSGVFLTVLGYGMGNYQDDKMQKLADKGNGNHAYIDQVNEAKKVLVNEFGGTLFTIAKDVKLQIEFNPANVQGYRLIGYENRMLAKEDFNNDKKDAGDMGSGHTVTALYEVIPAGVKTNMLDNVELLKYQPIISSTKTIAGTELMTIKLRYKKPGSDKSRLLEHPVADARKSWRDASENFRFAAAVAGYGMLLRKSEFAGNLNFMTIQQMAKTAIGSDKEGYRKEFLKLVSRTARINKVEIEEDVSIR